MIILKISLNFDPVKEILKIRCHIYILIKKMIILWKIQMKMKTFAPPFFIHFSLSLNNKKQVVMRATIKKLNIFTLQLPIDLLLEQEISNGANADIAKNEANETDGLYCRDVDVMLICSAKISEHKRSISPFSFYVQLPDYQSHVPALSTLKMSFSFCSWCGSW